MLSVVYESIDSPYLALHRGHRRGRCFGPGGQRSSCARRGHRFESSAYMCRDKPGRRPWRPARRAARSEPKATRRAAVEGTGRTCQAAAAWDPARRGRLRRGPQQRERGLLRRCLVASGGRIDLLHRLEDEGAVRFLRVSPSTGRAVRDIVCRGPPSRRAPTSPGAAPEDRSHWRRRRSSSSPR